MYQKCPVISISLEELATVLHISHTQVIKMTTRKGIGTHTQAFYPLCHIEVNYET